MVAGEKITSLTGYGMYAHVCLNYVRGRRTLKNVEERTKSKKKRELRFRLPSPCCPSQVAGWMADDSDSGGYTTDITSHHNPADSVCEGSVGRWVVGSAERIACSLCRRAGQTEEDGVDEAEDTRPFR